MTDHANKAADHAEHAGSALAAADAAGERRAQAVGVDDTDPGLTVDEQLTKAHVEATLSVAQRLADIGVWLEGIDNRLAK